MANDYQQIEWDEATRDDCRQIVRLAVREDLERKYDWTTVALVPAESTGTASVVTRRAGVIAGLPAAELALDEMNASVAWTAQARDGQHVAAGQTVAVVEGSTRDILTTERIVLNLLGRLSGVATLTRQYVDAIAGSEASLYDTRKTTPGWRRMEKYAVRCGGGRNHRSGLYDAILIKDNHLATFHGAGSTTDASADSQTGWCRSPADAVRRAKAFIAEHVEHECSIVEIEVDNLDQLAQVLPEQPDIILLDNMSLDELREAVALRDAADGDIELEASGGVNLTTVAAIAATGVDRISAGAITHSAIVLDLGLDWSV